MRALWKLCLVVVVAVGGLAGQMVMPEGTQCGIFYWYLSVGHRDWWPDTTGYPITLDKNLINAEGEAWRAAIGGRYTIMRADGSYTAFDINGVIIRNGTWFTIENYQITDHPYQTGPATVNITYYKYQENNGRTTIGREYYTFVMGLDESTHAQLRNCYYRTKAPPK